MKKIPLFILTASVSMMISCDSNNKNAKAGSDSLTASNPFYAPSKLPFGVPDFGKIKDSDFKPAMEAGIKEQQAEVQKIADNTAAPDFENTIVALEKSGQLLSRANHVFDLLTSANTNPTLQAVQEEMAPKLAANRDAIYLNSKLFSKVSALYARRDSLQLDAESKRLLEYYYQKFELAGAKLSEADKDKLKALNQEEATLSAKFNNQLLAAAKAGSLVVNDKAELAGLSQNEIDAAAQNATDAKQQGKWMLPLQNTTQQPALQSLTNRDTRKKLYERSWNRAERGDTNDTREAISRIAEIRSTQAKLLGFPNYAAWKLGDQMAKTPQAVSQMLGKLVPAATAKARQEAAEIQSVIDKENGGFQLEAQDWNLYAEKVRKAKYDLNEEEIKPYFELDKVLQNGVFYAAELLYGLTFKERKDLPVYHPDVRVFDVIDHDGSQIGLFYGDFYKRDNKNGGAWMSNLVEQSHLMGTKPVIYNVCNFTKPAAGQPALISFDDVTTMFHEFGHALHGLFANQKYVSLSGTSVARDYVEFPSQFNEHWASDPKVFDHYAVHYKTGAAMPQALKDKIKKAATFNQGYALTEILAASELDMQWHTIPAGSAKQNVDSFETTALKKTNLYLTQVPPRYRSSYFLHIWSNGYAAGYYAYTWTSMLENDAYAWFEEHGGLTRENGQRIRDMILSKGNTEDYNTMFRNFRGKDPDIKPLLKQRGLL
ncbi:peptidyl-dipeptidase Dcp [Filimonas effusa]|nr:peptidyl-dipeptidase Dcp [Filimonas effusa]